MSESTKAAPEVAMPGLSGLAIKRPVAVSMIVCAVGVFGWVSFRKLPVTLLPDVSYPTLTVRTEYPGAAPADIEKLITRRMEENLAVIADLANYRSISRAGVCDVILEFEWKTPMTFAAQDVREKVDQVFPTLPVGVLKPLILRFDPALDPILRLAVYDDGSRGLMELRRIAEEDIRRRLENLPGVAAVRIRGGFEEEWRVELREARLRETGISAADVARRIGEENANVAGGVLRDGDRESLVRTLGEITTTDELSELVVATQGGRQIPIKDLGTVVAGTKERDVITRVFGEESVEIEIFKEAQANTVAVAHAVKRRLYGSDWRTVIKGGAAPPKRKTESTQDLSITNEKEPPLATALQERGLTTHLLTDQSVFIESAVNDVWESAFVGAGLAVIVLLLFLRRLGATAIIGISIPISVVATFAPLYLSGVSLNIMSLGGLALGVGMLVDASIVVLESITRRREAGDSALHAAYWGTKDVGLAVVASTLTTIAVFLPIVFVEGIAGEFFRDQALVVVFSLMASLVSALFLVPMLASRTLPRDSSSTSGKFIGLIAPNLPWKHRTFRSLRTLRGLPDESGQSVRGLSRIVKITSDLVLMFPLELAARIVLVPLLGFVLGLSVLVRGLGILLKTLLWPIRWLFDHSYAAVENLLSFGLRTALKLRLVILIATGLLVAHAVTHFDRLGVELMPTVHQGEFTVEAALNIGTPVEETDRIAQAMSSGVQRALASEGLEIDTLGSSAGVARDVLAKAGEGAHTARVAVRLRKTGDLKSAEERAIAAIKSEFRRITEVKEPVFVRPSLFTAKTGLEVEVLGDNLEALHRAGFLVEDLLKAQAGLSEVQNSYRPGHPELVIEPTRGQLAFYDMTAGAIANLIRGKVQGQVGTRVSRGDRKVEVVVRAPREDVNERSEVLGLRINPGRSKAIPLSSVATLRQEPGPAEIRRVRGERAVVVSAEVADFGLRTAAAQVESALAEKLRNDPGALSGVTVRIAGQREESEKSQRSLLFALAIAAILVYIVMASQFESLLHPLVIMLTVPLAFVGVAYTLEYLGIKLSIVVLLGAILLVGIVVNNAIILIDAVNQRRRAGQSRDEALIESARQRLRPILMTTLTTVLGLLPLALGLGEGTEIRTPMAITVIAGLTSSTVLTLIVIPVCYSLVSRPGRLQTSEALQ